MAKARRSGSARSDGKSSTARVAPPSQSPAPAPAPTLRSPWLTSARVDGALIVGAPLWIVPLLYVLAAALTDRAINEWVLALGAIGHHLPGLVRAYGDRALYHRFRARFVLAPVALALACCASSRAGLHGLVLIAFVWGIWHAVMQTYGFARIYAAKSGSDGATDRTAARLDLALLFTWFIAGVLFSSLRMQFLVNAGALCGLPLLTPEVLHGARAGAFVVTVVTSLLWLGHTLRAAFSRRGVAPLRLLLIVSGIAFWCFANVRVRHPLLGTPLFELLHDAQYLTIVWAVSQRRIRDASATGNSDIARPLRALFHPSATRVLLYVAAVCAYGAVGLTHPSTPLGNTLIGLLTASQLLHFYYDGFIWKMREPGTSAALGIAAGGGRSDGSAKGNDSSAVSTTAFLSSRHTVLWAVLGVSATLLIVGETRARAPQNDVTLRLAELFPDSPLTLFPAAELRWSRGDREGALDGFRRARALDPDYAPARDNLALSLGDLADDAAKRGDTATARRYADELAPLLPELPPTIAPWAQERVAAYRR